MCPRSLCLSVCLFVGTCCVAWIGVSAPQYPLIQLTSRVARIPPIHLCTHTLTHMCVHASPLPTQRRRKRVRARALSRSLTYIHAFKQHTLTCAHTHTDTNRDASACERGPVCSQHNRGDEDDCQGERREKASSRASVVCAHTYTLTHAHPYVQATHSHASPLPITLQRCKRVRARASLLSA